MGRVGGRERVSEKGRRHNNRRGKLRRSRDIWKTLTIGEHWRSLYSREKCWERSGCLSCGAETPFPTCLPCNKLLHPSGLRGRQCEKRQRLLSQALSQVELFIL